MPDTANLIDSEALVIAHLNADTDVTDVVGDNIGTILPPDLPLPYCQIYKLAGTLVTPETAWLEHVRFNLAAWAATKPAAYEVAATVIRSFLTLPDTVHVLGVVTAAEAELTPFWSPDPSDEGPRYLATLAAYIHPGAGAAS